MRKAQHTFYDYACHRWISWILWLQGNIRQPQTEEYFMVDFKVSTWGKSGKAWKYFQTLTQALIVMCDLAMDQFSIKCIIETISITFKVRWLNTRNVSILMFWFDVDKMIILKMPLFVKKYLRVMNMRVRRKVKNLNLKFISLSFSYW